MTGPLVVSPVVVAVAGAIEGAMTGDLADVLTFGPVDDRQGYTNRSVTVGGRWDPDIQAVATDETISSTVVESGAARRQQETTDVQCVAYAGSGDDDIPGNQTAVGVILAAIRAALRSVTSVAGAATRAQLTDERWASGRDDQGSFVLASFTVRAVRLL